MWFAIVIACLSLCEFGATCNVSNDKTTCITEDLLQMLMGINTRKVSDGRLQPAFFASLVKQPYTLTGINDVVKFEDVRVNRGQGYNPSTGVFTAPRKGLYHISCLILGNNGHVVHYQLSKNDALYTYGYATKGVHTSSTISSLVEMKKGDRVFIKHRISRSEQITGNHHSTFSGYFLQE